MKTRTPHGFWINDGGRKLPSSHCRFCGIGRRRDKTRRWGLWEYFVNDAWTRKAPRCWRSENAGPEPPRKESKNNMEQARFFEPDYSTFMNVEEMEGHFADFKFLGAGWYIRKAQVLLVIPHPSRRPIAPDEPLYFVAAYHDRNPAEAFNQIVNAPVRVDVR